MGKGSKPEKGRNRELFRANYDDIFRKKADIEAPSTIDGVKPVLGDAYHETWGDEKENGIYELKELTKFSDEIGLERVKQENNEDK